MPQHRNTTKDEMKALNNLKKDKSRVVMKADKGNCLVVMDRSEYDEKMKSMLSDRDTYEIVEKPPFRKVERELNAQLLRFKNEQKLNYHTYMKLRSMTAHHLLLGIQLNTINLTTHYDLSSPVLALLFITLLPSYLTFLALFRIVTAILLLTLLTSRITSPT